MELIDKAKILKKKTTLYIPADSEETFSQDWEPVVVFVEDIKKAPAVDPVHAAGACYCRECRYWFGKKSCSRPGITSPLKSSDIALYNYTEETDFCSYGEPRTPPAE